MELCGILAQHRLSDQCNRSIGTVSVVGRVPTFTGKLLTQVTVNSTRRLPFTPRRASEEPEANDRP